MPRIKKKVQRPKKPKHEIKTFKEPVKHIELENELNNLVMGKVQNKEIIFSPVVKDEFSTERLEETDKILEIPQEISTTVKLEIPEDYPSELPAEKAGFRTSGVDISSASVNVDTNIDDYGDIIPEEQTKNLVEIPDIYDIKGEEEAKKPKRKLEKIKKEIEKIKVKNSALQIYSDDLDQELQIISPSIITTVDLETAQNLISSVPIVMGEEIPEEGEELQDIISGASIRLEEQPEKEGFRKTKMIFDITQEYSTAMIKYLRKRQKARLKKKEKLSLPLELPYKVGDHVVYDYIYYQNINAVLVGVTSEKLTFLDTENLSKAPKIKGKFKGKEFTVDRKDIENIFFISELPMELNYVEIMARYPNTDWGKSAGIFTSTEKYSGFEGKSLVISKEEISLGDRIGATVTKTRHVEGIVLSLKTSGMFISSVGINKGINRGLFYVKYDLDSLKKIPRPPPCPGGRSDESIKIKKENEKINKIKDILISPVTEIERSNIKSKIFNSLSKIYNIDHEKLTSKPEEQPRFYLFRFPNWDEYIEREYKLFKTDRLKKQITEENIMFDEVEKLRKESEKISGENLRKELAGVNIQIKKLGAGNVEEIKNKLETFSGELNTIIYDVSEFQLFLDALYTEKSNLADEDPELRDISSFYASRSMPQSLIELEAEKKLSKRERYEFKKKDRINFIIEQIKNPKFIDKIKEYISDKSLRKLKDFIEYILIIKIFYSQKLGTELKKKFSGTISSSNIEDILKYFEATLKGEIKSNLEKLQWEYDRKVAGDAIIRQIPAPSIDPFKVQLHIIGKYIDLTHERLVRINYLSFEIEQLNNALKVPKYEGKDRVQLLLELRKKQVILQKGIDDAKRNILFRLLYARFPSIIFEKDYYDEDTGNLYEGLYQQLKRNTIKTRFEIELEHFLEGRNIYPKRLVTTETIYTVQEPNTPEEKTNAVFEYFKDKFMPLTAERLTRVETDDMYEGRFLAGDPTTDTDMLVQGDIDENGNIEPYGKETIDRESSLIHYEGLLEKIEDINEWDRNRLEKFLLKILKERKEKQIPGLVGKEFDLWLKRILMSDKAQSLMTRFIIKKGYEILKGKGIKVEEKEKFEDFERRIAIQTNEVISNFLDDYSVKNPTVVDDVLNDLKRQKVNELVDNMIPKNKFYYQRERDYNIAKANFRRGAISNKDFDMIRRTWKKIKDETKEKMEEYEKDKPEFLALHFIELLRIYIETMIQNIEDNGLLTADQLSQIKSFQGWGIDDQEALARDLYNIGVSHKEALKIEDTKAGKTKNFIQNLVDRYEEALYDRYKDGIFKDYLTKAILLCEFLDPSSDIGKSALFFREKYLAGFFSLEGTIDAELSQIFPELTAIISFSKRIKYLQSEGLKFFERFYSNPIRTIEDAIKNDQFILIAKSFKNGPDSIQFISEELDKLLMSIELFGVSDDMKKDFDTWVKRSISICDEILVRNIKGFNSAIYRKVMDFIDSFVDPTKKISTRPLPLISGQIKSTFLVDMSKQCDMRHLDMNVVDLVFCMDSKTGMFYCFTISEILKAEEENREAYLKNPYNNMSISKEIFERTKKMFERAEKEIKIESL